MYWIELSLVTVVTGNLTIYQAYTKVKVTFNSCRAAT
jgi:hypothetical protein